MPDPAPNPNPNPNPAPAPDLAKELEALKAKNLEYENKIKELTAKPKPEDDPELIEKARKQKEADDKKSSDSKALEAAIRFGIKSEEFLKVNESLLPKEVSEIFKEAEKETYGNAVEKDSAIKSGIIQSFFKVQANVDMLTPGLKTNLDEYLKLTKTGKQEKAQQVYDTIFEPTFEMLKRIKKAEALNKGYGDEGDAETAYKNKLMAGSRKHYLGEKSNGT